MPLNPISSRHLGIAAGDFFRHLCRFARHPLSVDESERCTLAPHAAVILGLVTHETWTTQQPSAQVEAVGTREKRLGRATCVHQQLGLHRDSPARGLQFAR